MSVAARRALERVGQLLDDLVARAKPVRDDLKRVADEAPRSLDPFDDADFVLHSTVRAAVSAIDALEKAHAEATAELGQDDE